MTIAFSVVLRYADSGYSVGIFKLFLMSLVCRIQHYLFAKDNSQLSNSLLRVVCVGSLQGKIFRPYSATPNFILATNNSII